MKKTNVNKRINSLVQKFKGSEVQNMKTDLNYIKKLIKLLNSNDVSEIEIEEEGIKVRVVKNKTIQNPPPQIISHPSEHNVSPNISTLHSIEAKEEKTESKPQTKENLTEIRSPIVGTFYRAPSPNADPYVQVGQTVSPGTVLCIIEAMKLMNEIESEVSGKIVKILAENGKPVEYNQPLFLAELS
ncbi:MAG: acetyl-CoA carboxylase biotin carboxyl carrier protein [Ignavibacteria bacterium]